jgi:translation initiation factor IF-2
MSDTTKTEDQAASGTPQKTLTLKAPTGQPAVVRQNFSHGRSKAVVVEVHKKRKFGPDGKPIPDRPVTSNLSQPARPAPVLAPPAVVLPPPPPRTVMPVREAEPAAPPVAAEPAPVVAEAPVVMAPEPVVVVAPVVAPAPVAPAPAPAPAPVVAAAPVVAQPATPVAKSQAPQQQQPTFTRAPEPQRSAPQPQRSGGPSQRGGYDQRRQGSGPSGSSGGQQRTQAPANRGGMVLRELSEAEKSMRGQILQEARAREAEDRTRADEERRRRVELDDLQRKEREAAEQRKKDEEDRRRFAEETKRRAEAEARRRLGEGTPAPGGAGAGQRSASPGPRGGAVTPAMMGGRTATPGTPGAAAVARPSGARPVSEAFPARAAVDEDDERPRVGGAKRPMRPGVAVKPERRDPPPVTGAKRITLTNALLEEDARTHSVAAFRRRVQREKRKMLGDQPREKIVREVVIPETITIQELANRMSERAVDVIRLLMKQGQMAKITDVIDADTAQLIAEEMGHSVKRVAESDIEEGLFDEVIVDEILLPRPPVVTIMGHVDHGKTSLLDALRKTNVVAGEAGGITQHIGAYQVTSPLGGKITFVDTPGHEAFTAMRARGAKVTDIVVLVVAADDGVMPQTAEAISHARAAKVPLIVAINKIDKPDANPDKVRAELLQYDIQVESMGGETLEVAVSALKKTNLDKLLEVLQLQSEVLDLKANPNRPAEAIVVEAKLDKGRGPVATAIIQRGTLRVGDIVVAGSVWGRVRALIDETGSQTPEATPSMPIEILGFAGVPEAGDRLAVVSSEGRAREIADYRDRKRREKAQARLAGGRTSMADMMTQLRAGAGKKEMTLLVKGDVQGSVEAIQGSLEKIGNDEVGSRVILSGVGAITESDVTLAAASRAVIIGFNVRANREAREAAEREGIEIRYYNIIYDLVDDVKQVMSGMLAPTRREEIIGNAAILEVFSITKFGKIAGCRVTDGKVERGAGVRLLRDNVVVHQGKLSTLKRFKDDAKEVVVGQECGMSFENYQDMRPGDVIECYRVTEEKRSL